MSRAVAGAQASESENAHLSFWHATCAGPARVTPSLAEDIDVDVAIVGAGFTGLWTAYYLKSLDPSLSVCVLEANFPGFGASGRNGGWAVGEMAGMATRFADPTLRDSAIRLQRALFDAVSEIGRVSEKENIDCHYAKGGTINVATSPAFEKQLQAEAEHWASLGFGEADFRWLSSEESSRVVRTRENLGGLFSPHCAAIHPQRLVSGLVTSVERMGVRIYSDTPATSIEAGRVSTPGGTVKAGMVVGATEAYTDSIAGRKRRILPFHSMMIATEPLSEAIWHEIGLNERETFGDPRRMVIYGQRTLDGRLAFGARGGYFFGSAIHSRFSPTDVAFEHVRQCLENLFPVLSSVEVTHCWGGALGIPRNWRPVVGIDRGARFSWAGGYVGEGVAATNLAGQTLADLILETDSPLVDLAWVGPAFKRWEPEPLRWLGVAGLGFLGERLDAIDLAGRTSPRLLNWLHDWMIKK